MGIFTNFSRLPRKFFKFSRNDIPTPSLRAKRSNPVKSRKNSAFTLAEIMIVLSVIGILTAILLPAARQITPDENVIKFKKAHNTLYSTVRELVTSDKYYLDGDLGIKPDGTRILGSFSNGGGATTSDTSLIKYFCNSFADIVSTKSVNCSTTSTCANCTPQTFVSVPANGPSAGWDMTYDVAKTQFDSACSSNATSVGAEIITTDGVSFFQVNPAGTFGLDWGGGVRLLTADMGGYYKVFCFDVDTFGSGEAPFGYGIRADGKILNGARADAWLNKSIQGDD